MAAKRVSMRKVREVLRLTHEMRLSVREVSEATGVGKTAVAEYVARARVIGITWPVPPEIDDGELERRLFVPAGHHEGSARQLPDWAKVHEELKRRGHKVEVGGDWTEGRLVAAAKEGTLLKAAANPRGMQGYAIGR